MEIGLFIITYIAQLVVQPRLLFNINLIWYDFQTACRVGERMLWCSWGYWRRCARRGRGLGGVDSRHFWGDWLRGKEHRPAKVKTKLEKQLHEQCGSVSSANIGPECVYTAYAFLAWTSISEKFGMLYRTHTRPSNNKNAQYFPIDPPARTCIGVASLPLGADMEVECIAELP